MILHRPSSPVILNRPRSNSHPVRSQRVGTPSEINGDAPVRPPRNPARPVTLGEDQLAPPPPVASKPTTAFRDDRREQGIGGERYKPSVSVSPSNSKRQPPQTTPLPQINTLDRKILQELKRSMLARSAQFTLKNNTKYHPFPTDEVPYPRSYDHKCIDTDVWETVFCEQFCGNVTFHTFDVPPTKVLDLGCGSGSWIITCARQWKTCHFVGLDIVPLHPDLGRSELSQRVSWVQANFLEPLPFPNEEFDFVHIKRVARGVPEHKWDALFEEIIRVMKPGAALEMLEEDLYIPGQMMDSTDSDSPLSTASSSGSSEELSLLSTSSVRRPSGSLSEISIGQSYSGARSSTSESPKELTSGSQASSNAFPRHSNRRTLPPNTRPFPLLKPSNPKLRSKTSHFNLHNLLAKRSGNDGGAGTDGEQPSVNKKESSLPVSSNVGLCPLLTSRSSASLNRKHSTKKTHSPISSGGGFQPPKLYFNTAGTSSNLMLGSNTSIHHLPMPPQNLDRFGGRDSPLTLPPAENTSGKSEVDLPRNRRSEESRQARARSFSDPTPEDDGQRRTAATHDFEPFDLNTIGMHDHVQQVRSSHVRNPRHSGVLADVEPIDPGQQDWLTAIPPVPPLKDIPERSRPQAIPSSSSSNEIFVSTTGLSRSMPERFPDHQLLSPPLEATGPKLVKSLSTSSLAISHNRSTGPVSPLSQGGRSDGNSGVGNTSPTQSPSPAMPPNPREHKLLELIYTEMHAARFINLAPLSLLENYIRTYFKNVRTHAPLIFAFPPPPGCDHRTEFDAAELQQGRLNLAQILEGSDDQDRYIGPDTSPSTRSLPPSPSVPPHGNPRFILPHPTRERSSSVTTNEPGPSRARSSSIKSTHLFTNPETDNRRQPHSRDSRFAAGLGDGAVPDRLVVTGDGLLTRTKEYVMMDTSMIGGFSPARAARAAKKSASSTSDERECSRQRSDSLFTSASDMKGKGEGGEGRKRLPAPAPRPTEPSILSLFPLPPPLEYGGPGATSSTSLSPSVASSSSSTTIRHDLRKGKGKRDLTAAERAQLSALSNKKAEIDIRSLNLHLRARVVEILGCSEAMWDWIKEFQHRESEKEKKLKEQEQVVKPVQRVGGGRVSYYHQDRNRNRGGAGGRGNDNSALHRKRSTGGLSTGASSVRRGQGTSAKVSGRMTEPPSSYLITSFGSTKTDDLSEYMGGSVKKELANMTRGRFNELLAWFQFDMDDSIRLTRSMATRTPGAFFTADPTEQRKLFDEACQKLETYFQEHQRPPISPAKSNSIANGCESVSGSPPQSQISEEELCCLPPLLNLVHPSKRLCRTIRVWVAWKP